jgi:hypothetical protein
MYGERSTLSLDPADDKFALEADCNTIPTQPSP